MCRLAVAAATSNDDGFKAGSDNTIPAGARSIAAGSLNAVNGYSIATGSSNLIDALSSNSGSFGSSNSTYDSDAAFLFGDTNAVTAEASSFVAGSGNVVTHSTGKSGANNILLGTSNSIDGAISGAPSLIESNILLGSGNLSYDSKAWVLGKGNIGQPEVVTLGRYAQTVSGGAALIVGNGSAANARSNALVVERNGDVSIPGGVLLLGADPALGQASALALMDVSGYMKRAIGTGASISNGGLLAVGENANASASGSIVIGNGSVVTAEGGIAIGQDSEVASNGLQSIAFSGGLAGAPYSYAVGGGQTWATFSMATMLGVTLGNGSIAMGGWDATLNNFPGNVAAGESSMSFGGVSNRSDGFASISGGFWTKASTAYSLALGSLNRSGGSSSTEWVDTDPLFELGNGIAPRSATEPDASNRSNAITTLKNGQTTLENKYWSASSPLSSPSSTSEISSGAEALVVKGHTRLKGKVTIEEPQGDILMGIFGE